MRNQYKVALYKLRHFLIFFIGILVMAGAGFSHGFIKLVPIGFHAYDAFQLISDTSFMFLLALISAWFIGRDFSDRTIHHEIKLGYSRWSVLLVREFAVILCSVVLHFIYVFSTVLGVAVRIGFSGAMFRTADVLWCITVMLQLMGLQSVFTMITFICAAAPTAIAATTCFAFIACNILRSFLNETFFTKTVFCLARDNSPETLLPAALVAVLTLIGSTALTYLIFRRREIK